MLEQIFPVLIVLALVLTIVGSSFIASKVYRGMKQNNEGWAMVVAVVVFLVSFCLIGITFAWIILSNIRIER